MAKGKAHTAPCDSLMEFQKCIAELSGSVRLAVQGQSRLEQDLARILTNQEKMLSFSSRIENLEKETDRHKTRADHIWKEIRNISTALATTANAAKNNQDISSEHGKTIMSLVPWAMTGIMALATIYMAIK